MVVCHDATIVRVDACAQKSLPIQQTRRGAEGRTQETAVFPLMSAH
jgi:hypothetical protein